MEGRRLPRPLTVVELSSVLAGPAVGLFFAELGARVVKVENAAAGGDITRQWKVPEEDPAAPDSAYYWSVNWGKEIWMEDLTDPDARKRVHNLVATADIVISNYTQTTAEKLDMHWEKLAALRPELIFAQITGFGPDDPRPAYDVVLQAEAGFLFMTGEPGRPPVKMPVALIDLLAAHQLKQALLLALWEREITGRGGRVAVSLLDAALASLANQATNWLMAGHLPQPMGSEHPNIAPYGDSFLCRDGQRLVLAVGTDRQFASLCALLQKPELAADLRFARNANRVQNRSALIRVLEPLFMQQDAAEWMARLNQYQAPAGRVRDMRSVFELPAAQRMIQGEGRVRCMRTVAFTRE